MSTGVTVIAGHIGGNRHRRGNLRADGRDRCAGRERRRAARANADSLAVSLGEGSTFAAEILSATSFDQLAVTGTVTLSNPTLGLTLANGITLPVNTTFKIIDNDAADAVAGTFANLS